MVESGPKTHIQNFRFRAFISGMSHTVWLIMMTSSMSSQTCGNLLKFSVCFFDFSRLQVNLWPQLYHQNDRKKTENLFIYDSKKMLIFDQKILEVANRSWPSTLRSCLSTSGQWPSFMAHNLWVISKNLERFQWTMSVLFWNYVRPLWIISEHRDKL